METTYQKAVNYLHNSLILCNTITELVPSVIDNVRFDLFNEDGDPKDIFQYFLTDCSKDDVEFLEQHFNLLFTYSDALDLYVLCVDHYGTHWGYVSCETDLDIE